MRLAIDTATVVCVGLATDEQVLRSEIYDDSRAHVEQLAPQLRELLTQSGVAWSDIDSIVVGVGPGPFTGLRVGVAAACTLAETLGIPVKGVCSLDAAALSVTSDTDFVVASDARRSELYWAVYNSARQRLQGPFVTVPSELPTLRVFGSGAGLVPESGLVSKAGLVPEAVTRSNSVLDAGLMARFAAQLPDVGTEPLYLRRPDAQVSTRRKSVLTFRRTQSSRRTQ